MNQPLRHHGLIHGLMPVVCLSMILMFLGGIFGLNCSAAAQPKPAPSEEGAQVLTRGPVHEAFAESVTFDPQPGVVVPKAPPEAVEELPPDQRPEGDNVAWIPGYWAWDDERDDFLWISGIWRDMPPGRQWVSGYWREAGNGFQWISGYWAAAEQNEVEVLSEAPPATLEAGPNVPAPSPDQAWVPGLWTWRQTRYAWRPGFWTVPQPGWVWVPAYYVWTPGGFVLVGGYWDYPVPSRGVLFAPVYFTAGIYSAPGYFYTPATVINLAVFSDHLFLRPRYCHYYFGDYYAASYVGMGFYPWFSINIHQGYDPIFAYQRWEHRHDNDWHRNVQASYQHRREHEDARPAHTWNAEMARSKKPGAPVDKAGAVAVSLDQMGRSKDVPVKLRSIDKQERDKVAAHSKEIQQFRQQRKDLEAKAPPAKGDQAAKVKLPTSPFVTGSPGQKVTDQAKSGKKDLPRAGISGQPGTAPRGGRVQNPSQQAASGTPPTVGKTPGASIKGQELKKGDQADLDRSNVNRRKATAGGQASQQGGPQVQDPPGPKTQQGAAGVPRSNRSGSQLSPGGNQPPEQPKLQQGPSNQSGIGKQQQQQPQMRRQQLGSQTPQQPSQRSNLGQPGGGSGPPQQNQGGGDRRTAPSQRQFNAAPSGQQGPPQAPQMRKGPQRPPQGAPPDKKKDPRENR